jgi:RNA polymerase sigma-70 factor (ECF subfamily)
MTIRQKQAIFEASYHDLFGVCYRYVVYRVPTSTDAEDVVASGFYKAWKKLRSFDPERGNLQQWLFGIMKTEVLQYYRTTKPVVDLETVLPYLQAETVSQEDLDQVLLSESILATVTEDQRALLALRHIDGLTYEEIAQLIGKQPAAVRNNFSRLHRKLRDQFSLITTI